MIRHPARALVAGLVLLAGTARAHEVRPAYLELRENGPAEFDVLWKVPANGEERLGLDAILPGDCSSGQRRGTFAGDAFVERWHATCPGGLVGGTVAIDGLRAASTDVLARVERRDGTTQTARLTPERPSFEVVAAPGRLDVARMYLALGIEHILLGVDHLLFVAGLLFLVGDGRRLLATVTAFTVAHSITLAAASLGWVHVPGAPVEATIALSVMFVAAEILRGARGQAGLATRAPWVVAFAFGLLHGLGFAGALREVGLPERDVALALLFFNVGVEIGQLLFVAAAIAALSGLARLLRGRAGRADAPWHGEALIRVPVAYLTGSIAAFWFIQRVAAFRP